MTRYFIGHSIDFVEFIHYLLFELIKLLVVHLVRSRVDDEGLELFELFFDISLPLNKVLDHRFQLYIVDFTILVDMFAK